uniref:Uncharacterized protein n=1 Tax=Rhizophora mucronata TaxID=61149 RepID=A0A2P2R3D9_RHIMU
MGFLKRQINNETRSFLDSNSNIDFALK